MKNRLIIAISLFLLLTTITTQKKLLLANYNLTDISIENNFLLKDEEITETLSSIYSKNLIFLSNKEIQNILVKNDFIDSFKIRKIYPDTLKITIIEKKPIAILQNKNKKFFLSEKNEIIAFRELKNLRDLPYIYGDRKNFKILYENLEKIKFPISIIKNFTLFGSNRWDLITNNKQTIKLPSKNYTKNLENYLELRKRKNFEKYKVFDYRIEGQLILK